MNCAGEERGKKGLALWLTVCYTLSMNINNKTYKIEGIISLGENTRRLTGYVFEVVLKGARGAFYTLSLHRNGNNYLADSRHNVILRNVEAV